MTTSDRLLTVLAKWCEDGDYLPVSVEPRLRDWDGVKGSLEVIFDAEDPLEHPVLRGVETIEGEIMLDVSADDSSQDGRQLMLSDMAAAYDVDNFLTWANDENEDRGLVLGEGLKVYDFRMAAGGSWETEDRRFIGRLKWTAVAAGVVDV